MMLAITFRVQKPSNQAIFSEHPVALFHSWWLIFRCKFTPFTFMIHMNLTYTLWIFFSVFFYRIIQGRIISWKDKKRKWENFRDNKILNLSHTAWIFKRQGKLFYNRPLHAFAHSVPFVTTRTWVLHKLQHGQHLQVFWTLYLGKTVKNRIM